MTCGFARGPCHTEATSRSIGGGTAHGKRAGWTDAAASLPHGVRANSTLPTGGGTARPPLATQSDAFGDEGRPMMVRRAGHTAAGNGGQTC